MQWLANDRVFLVTVYDKLTIAEIAECGQEIVAWSKVGTAPVHAIVEVLAKSPPTDMQAIRDAIRHIRKPDCHGWVVLVVENPIVSFIASMMVVMTGTAVKAFVAYEAAAAFLQAQDPTLPPLTRPILDPPDEVSGG